MLFGLELEMKLESVQVAQQIDQEEVSDLRRQLDSSLLELRHAPTHSGKVASIHSGKVAMCIYVNFLCSTIL